MPRSIDLNPGNLNSYYYSFDADLDQAITNEFNNDLKSTVAESIIQPDLDADQLLQSLHASIDQVAPKVFSARYAFEQEWRFGEKPLLQLLGRLALDSDDVPELVPSESYLADLHLQIDDFGGTEALKALHDVWPLETFKYLSALDGVIKGQGPKRGDMALEIVRRMSEDTEHLTLDPDHAEGLLLITHFPDSVRQLTRRLLVGNHIAARLERSLGGDITSEEKEMLEALRRYYELDNLHGQQWESKKLALTEDSQVEIARYSAEQLIILSRLQREADKDSGQRFKDFWDLETEELNDSINALSGDFKTRQWQLIDNGHAFEGFKSYDLMRAFRYGMYSRGGGMEADLQPEKSGRRAVILEDDDSQRALWKETIQNSTSFTTEDNLSFASPQGLDEVIDDMTIGLFLLDIQNGEDETAGIRVGEEVLRRRYKAMNDSSVARAKTKIIIWSASSDAVEYADAYFKALIEGPMQNVGCRLTGRSGGHSSDIMVEVRPKTWHSYSDVE